MLFSKIRKELGGTMAFRKRKIITLAALLIIAAAAVALCASYFSGSKINEFEGTLVNGSQVLLWL